MFETNAAENKKIKLFAKDVNLSKMENFDEMKKSMEAKIILPYLMKIILFNETKSIKEMTKIEDIITTLT